MTKPEAKIDPNNNNNKKTDVSEGNVKRSIHLCMIRHAESANNQVYTNARYLYRGGTPDFDLEGWTQYVDAHRQADPDLSDRGRLQAEALAQYLVPHLQHQASRPVRILTSPMKRTLQTIRPTLEQLQQQQPPTKIDDHSSDVSNCCQVKCVAFYHESEGCHFKEQAEEGMKPTEISELFQKAVPSKEELDFVGFPKPDRGWYVNGTSSETRVESEARAAKFYLWLCDYLDAELLSPEEDVFDAGVAVPGEEEMDEHDKFVERQRRRRTALLIGHGDFMSLVLKRIIAGFGHSVENEGIPHRSAFVHFNTGMTELEYFGAGRFLLMSSNQTPHIAPDKYAALRTGGSLKDGWSYLMPNDEFVLNAEVSVAFSDEEIDEHVLEQKDALKALYLSSHGSSQFTAKNGGDLIVEEETHESTTRKRDEVHFMVQRGLQVIACATLDSQSGQIYDVAIKPSAQKDVVETLMSKIKDHTRKAGRSGSLLVKPRSGESLDLFQKMGFAPSSSEDVFELELS